jgi:hypothetical protein
MIYRIAGLGKRAFVIWMERRVQARRARAIPPLPQETARRMGQRIVLWLGSVSKSNRRSFAPLKMTGLGSVSVLAIPGPSATADEGPGAPPLQEWEQS